MLEYVLIAGALAFTAAIQPGPSQAYLLSRVAAIGWRRTLPAALAPLLSDGPIAVLALIVLGQLSVSLQSILRTTGGLLLLYFAWRTYRQWRRRETTLLTPGAKAPRTLIEATLVNLLNPYPYLGWTLILGPLVVGAWQQAPRYGIAVIVAFYTVMVTTLAVSIVALGSARLLGPRLQRFLLLLSGIILVGLGVYQLVIGMQYFAAVPAETFVVKLTDNAKPSY